MNLKDLIPSVNELMPFLDVRECTYEESGSYYLGLAFIHQSKPTIHGAIYMTTMVIVDEYVVFGMHSIGGEPVNHQKLLSEIDSSHLISVLSTVWLTHLN